MAGVTSKPRRHLIDTLESLEWAGKHFAGLHTNGVVPRRRVMTAVRKGLAESVGFGPPCDGDGFTLDGRRDREIFALTDAGREYLKRHREAPTHGR